MVGTGKNRNRKAMRKVISRIRQEFDLSDMKGDPLEDLAKFFNFLTIVVGIGILSLVIELIIWIINNI
jgi:hypothetical protein